MQFVLFKKNKKQKKLFLNFGFNIIAIVGEKKVDTN